MRLSTVEQPARKEARSATISPNQCLLYIDTNDGKNVRLISRKRNEFNYPQLLDALKLLPVDRVILDGEIAALDEKGRSSFQLLQLFKSSGAALLVYYVFGLLFAAHSARCFRQWEQLLRVRH